MVAERMVRPIVRHLFTISLLASCHDPAAYSIATAKATADDGIDKELASDRIEPIAVASGADPAKRLHNCPDVVNARITACYRCAYSSAHCLQ